MTEFEIEKLLREAFEKGEATAKKYGSVAATWVSYYDFDRDPFSLSPPKKRDEIQLLRGRDSILSELGEFIGGSPYLQESVHVKIVGPSGSGKSSLLNTLYLLAKNEIEVIFWDIYYDEPIFQEYNEGQLDPIIHKDFGVVFFDNCYKESRAIMRIRQRHTFSGLILSSWPPLLGRAIECNRMISLKPLKTPEIIDLIKTRLRYGGNEEALDETAIQKITEFGNGNPWLLLYLMRQVFEEGFSRRQKNIDTDLITKVARTNHLIGELEFDLTSRERDVMLEIMQLILAEGERGITPRELTKSLNISRPLAWKYLERLKKKNLLSKSYQGRSTVFKLDKINQIRYEQKLMEDL